MVRFRWERKKKEPTAHSSLIQAKDISDPTVSLTDAKAAASNLVDSAVTSNRISPDDHDVLMSRIEEITTKKEVKAFMAAINMRLLMFPVKM